MVTTEPAASAHCQPAKNSCAGLEVEAQLDAAESISAFVITLFAMQGPIWRRRAGPMLVLHAGTGVRR
jgi:hypothetical protein